MSEAEMAFSEVLKFTAHLRSLRKIRLSNKVASEVNKKRPTKADRAKILSKTGAHCHICGGKIEGKWVADHVYPHSLSGENSFENLLPAHPICNRAKWFYETEEFQWILKMGVFFRTQLEEVESPEAAALAKLFLIYEKQRNARRKGNLSNADA